MDVLLSAASIVLDEQESILSIYWCDMCLLFFCWTWWSIGNFPLLVVNDSISNSAAPVLLVTKQIVAPSGGVIALQHSYACRNLSMVRWRIIMHLKGKKCDAIQVAKAFKSCDKFTSNSRTKGWLVVLAHTLRRLSISRMRIKSHTGFCLRRQLKASSPVSAAPLKSAKTWKIRQQAAGCLKT